MTVKNKGLLAAGAVAVAASLALAGCSGGSGTAAGSGDDAKSTLVVWVDADRGTVLKDAAAAFEKESGVAVKLVQKDFPKIQAEFLAQVPTGKGPDITIGAHDWLGNLVSNGVVQPVELGETAGDYQPVAVQAMSYEGTTYGVPYSIENIALLRNTALAPTAPATFDDMVAAGVAAGSEFPYLVGLTEEADPYHLYPFQTSFGAPVFATNPDGSYNPDELKIGDPGGEAFATWLAAEGAAGRLTSNLTGDLAKEKFIAGASPFYITGPWTVPEALDGGVDVAVDPIPSAGGQPSQPFVGVQGFFVSAKTKNALAANEFLVNYIGSEKVQTELYDIGGRPPALTSAFEAASSDPITAGFGAVAATAVPMPSIPQMGKVWQFWGVTEAAIISGTGDPVALWQKMAADVEAAVKE